MFSQSSDAALINMFHILRFFIQGSKNKADNISTTLERSNNIQRKSSIAAGFTKPTINIEQFLHSEVTPTKEEYNHLKNLDETQNVSRNSTKIANAHIAAAESLNRYSY